LRKNALHPGRANNAISEQGRLVSKIPQAGAKNRRIGAAVTLNVQSNDRWSTAVPRKVVRRNPVRVLRWEKSGGSQWAIILG
jgi:hypothetical protein